MKLIQTYWTKGGESYNCGFASFAEMIDFWQKSTIKHLENYEVVIFTDTFGAAKISGLLPEGARIEVINFERIDDRYMNICKFQTYLDQTESFLHVDIDACLNDKIESIETDVICEKLREGYYGRYLSAYELKPLNIQKTLGIPCSGLLGFKNHEFAKKYAQIAIDKIRKSEKFVLTFEALFTIEEILLGNLIDDENLTISTFTNYVHLQGAIKN